MGTAYHMYRLGEMAKGEVHDLFIHPFPSRFVSFDVNAFAVNKPGIEPAARLEVLGSYDHVDGKGYLLRITNVTVEHGGNPRIFADLLAFEEDLSN